MLNKTMLIAEAIDTIKEQASEIEDMEILVSSEAALKTLVILQRIAFKSITIDQYLNM